MWIEQKTSFIYPNTAIRWVRSFLTGEWHSNGGGEVSKRTGDLLLVNAARCSTFWSDKARVNLVIAYINAAEDAKDK